MLHRASGSWIPLGRIRGSVFLLGLTVLNGACGGNSSGPGSTVPAPASPPPSARPSQTGQIVLGAPFVPIPEVWAILTTAVEQAGLPTDRNWIFGCRSPEIYDQAKGLTSRRTWPSGTIPQEDLDEYAESLSRYLAFLASRVGEEECGLFYGGATIHWDGTQRGEPPLVSILVRGTPDTGDPLRPAQNSPWWISPDSTSFGSEGSRSVFGRGSAFPTGPRRPH